MDPAAGYYDDDDADESMEVVAAGVDDDGEVMAAVVVDDEDVGDDDADTEDEADAVVVPAVMVEAAPAPAPPPAKATTTQKKKRGPAPKSKGTKAKGGGAGSKGGGGAGNKTNANAKKKKKKTNAAGGGASKGEQQKFSRISTERLDAAAKARKMLVEGAPTLPLITSDIHVRCFGRLSIEPATDRSKFSKANALYPVGYSCDRYEFSPVHGRILKMRCSILDGKKIKETQTKMGVPVAVHLHDGPVFRIMWGQGIDEDKDDVEYAYDPYSMSAPLSSNSDEVDAVAIPTTKEGAGKKPVIPKLGMRVQAKFDRGQVFKGTITRVGKANETPSTTRKRKQVEIEIQYDDGFIEIVMFPDPEISLLLPEAEPEVDKQGNLEHRQFNGLPVHTVIGMSPIEAWGKVLSKLGLSDEIISNTALDAMVSSRDIGLKEAKGKIEARGRRKSYPDTNGRLDDDGSDRTNSDMEDASMIEAMAEGELMSKVASLRSALEGAKSKERVATVELANKRISALGSYLSNPFADKDPSNQQQSNWLALAVRKEKTKMGSTGNKKKIVTATDLLERNDTFYNQEIESLIEGLPGSEYCASYIFQSMRTGGVAATNRAWVHEAQVRSEKEREKRIKATKQATKKESKEAIKKRKALEIQQQKEKEALKKRKERDDLRDERKRQKLEEEEEKKRARIDERLSRLNVQVEERLFKEACFQREKAIIALAKTFTREYNRRRRSAEIVAGQSISDKQRRNGVLSQTDLLPLPKLSKVYDEDVLRVWDFVSTFGAFFVEKEWLKEIPTMDSLQSAIDTLRNAEAGKLESNREEAVSSLIELAVALCKPLAASQTRLLFASLIALYPVLQKDFGAAFFNEVNEVKGGDKKEKEKENGSDKEGPSHADVILPVNAMTWQEIARVSFLSDALGELGYDKPSSAHLLRGYRSAGHPNSKEARRLRRVEDFSIALLRQALSDGTQGKMARRPNIVRIEIPTTPSCLPTDFMFYLHNVRLMRASDVACMKKNVMKAVELLKAGANASLKDGVLGRLENCLGMIKKPEAVEASSFKKAKNLIVEYLDSQVDPSEKERFLSKKDDPLSNTNQNTKRKDQVEASRQNMGILGSLSLTQREYKRLVHERDEYMSDAMKLKEEMERQRRKENNEGDDDDDDDIDDDDDDEDDVETNRRKSMGKSSDDTPAGVAAALVTSEGANKADAAAEENPSREKTKSQDEPMEEGKASHDPQSASSAKGEQDAKEEQTVTKNEPASLKVEPEPAEDGATAMEIDGDGDKLKEGDGALKKEDEQKSQEEEEQKPEEQSSLTKTEGDDEEDPPPPAPTDPSAPTKIGKPTQYDDFCADIPTAPELIRRCLAVLRSLALAGPSEPFLYPVDPQTNPGYYDMVLRPMCLWKAGKILQSVAEKLKQMSEVAGEEDDTGAIHEEIDKAVLEFGRNIRLISHNCHSYANAGPMVISAGGEFLRIFERLFLDWVLAPTSILTPLDELDDDKCVEHHVSDEDSTVLLCDGCEGNFNISRLDPPLTSVPKGDWYCPRCVSGRWWGHLDPRVGKVVQRNEVAADATDVADTTETVRVVKGEIKKCFFRCPEGSHSPSLCYKVSMADGTTETWNIEQVDRSLDALGQSVPPARCIAALAESQGYGCARPDKSLLRELVPIPLNPNISDGAAQAALSSTVFRDTIHASGTLMLVNPEDMKAAEWLRLLLLLVMKCSASDVMQNVASQYEKEAEEGMGKHLESLGKVSDISEILDEVNDDGDDDEEEGEEEEVAEEEEEEDVTMDDASGENGNTEEKEQAPPQPEKPENSGNSSPKPETQAGGGPKEAEMNGETKPSTVEVEPSAVEVVAAAPGALPPTEGGEPQEIVAVDPIKEKRSAALAEKSKRQRAREESIAAYSMKSQLRPTVASFEEDAVSQVIDSALSSKVSGLSFPSTRCRKTTCNFCGLTDVALGTPLVRVPDEGEWDEIIPHASRSRRAQLVAHMQGKGISDGSDDGEDDAEKKRAPESKFVSLKIKIGDELVSIKETDDVFDRTDDGGMLEFCPRNAEGFQSELAFRSETGLPYITGSLSAHECCAIAAHKARKVHVVQRFKERQLELADANAGMTCGRTLAIGTDDIGRFYWKFHKDPDSLLVFVPPRPYSGERGQWHRFSDSASIASLIVSLGRESVAKDLKRAYPDAAKMCREGSWSNAIWSRRFPNAIKALKNSVENGSDSGSIDGRKRSRDEDSYEEPPFEINEEVLVESKSGNLLWDAKVLEVAFTENEKVSGYRVRYTGWSSRFDEWVDNDRLVEPSDNNRQVQYEMLEEFATQRDGLPPALNEMEALRFLKVRDRARGNNLRLPDFAVIANASAGASTDDRHFAVTKAAVLLVEAALPIGSVDTTSKGPWKPELAQQWRLMVERAEGPAKLMRCVILLEDVITEEWLKTDVGHLRSCLPNRWKALGEVSVASLAIRVETLDRAIRYSLVDKSRFKEPKQKKK